jgi:DNA recombination protein RmuC
LYDKFEGFVGDLIKIGKNRRKQTEYSGAMNKLVEGKEINCKCRKLKKMGLKLKSTSRSILNRAEKRRK